MLLNRCADGHAALGSRHSPRWLLNEQEGEGGMRSSQNALHTDL